MAFRATAVAVSQTARSSAHNRHAALTTWLERMARRVGMSDSSWLVVRPALAAAVSKACEEGYGGGCGPSEQVVGSVHTRQRQTAELATGCVDKTARCQGAAVLQSTTPRVMMLSDRHSPRCWEQRQCPGTGRQIAHQPGQQPAAGVGAVGGTRQQSAWVICVPALG